MVLKQTEPMMCGGTDAYQDTRAPKEIGSQDMILFDAASAFGGMICPQEDEPAEPLAYLSAFAVPAKDGYTFAGWSRITSGDYASTANGTLSGNTASEGGAVFLGYGGRFQKRHCRR